MSEGDGPSRRDLCRYPLASAGGLRREVPSVEAEARRLTRAAIDQQSPALARRAMAVRAEAEVVRQVSAWSRPALEGDAGPAGPGRGTIVAGNVSTMTYSPRKDDWIPTVTVTARRAMTRTLSSLGPTELNAALRYEDLVARRDAVVCVDPAGAAVSGQISDGGAASRWEMDRLLTRVERAIGTGVALKVQRQRRSDFDRGHRGAITVRVLTDAVCLYGRSIEDVLGRHGWSRRQDHRDQLRAQLVWSLRRVAAVIG